MLKLVPVFECLTVNSMPKLTLLKLFILEDHILLGSFFLLPFALQSVARATPIGTGTSGKDQLLFCNGHNGLKMCVLSFILFPLFTAAVSSFSSNSIVIL